MNGTPLHPLPGPTRESRRGGHPVLRRLVLTRELEHPEVGDAEAAVVEPSSAPPPPEDDDSDWWTKPYAGGPMVKVPGFPRALYPPDVPAKSGHEPSVKGPDVVAYKRTVCRLGRWKPWEPDKWDEAYSNAFSHGRASGGDVGDTGIAGVQRQQGIDPTGWLGERTFNTLRSARVPTGPHAGEMAMDSVAVNLIEEAWSIAQTPDEPDPATGTIDDVKRELTDYLLRSIRAASKWHYSQARAMTNMGTSPDVVQSGDCSSQSTTAYYWSRKQTGVAVPDPNRYCPGFGGYNGYGWTGSLVYAPRCYAPYREGDLAIYGPSTGDTSHVCTCYADGDASSSEWCSNGSEEGPYAVELNYRSDLLCVVRPGLMP
jgi:hypothetical protein